MVLLVKPNIESSIAGPHIYARLCYIHLLVRLTPYSW